MMTVDLELKKPIEEHYKTGKFQIDFPAFP